MKTIFLLIKCVALALVVLLTDSSSAQVASFKDGLRIGAKGQPNSKAILDVVSTTKGFLPPRMTEAQRDAITTPPAGLLIFNTDTSTLNQYDGTSWGAVAGAASGAQYNVISNFGFEDSTYDADWTASGGSLAEATGSNILFGAQSATWDSSSAAQTLSYASQTIGQGFKGNNCEGAIYVQTPSGTSTHQLQVFDGTNAIAAVAITSSTTPQQFSTGSFPCPTSGSWQLRVLSVAANEPLIAVDDAYLGLVRNVGTAQQALHKGSIRMTGCTDWSRSSTSFGNFTATSGCSYVVTGDVLAPSTFIPGFRLQNVGPGRYLIFARGSWFKSVTTTNADIYLRLSDGTNNFGEQAVEGGASSSGQSAQASSHLSGAVTYSAAQPTTTFQLQGLTSNTASATAINISDDGGPGASSAYTEGLQFDVYYFPTSQQSVVSQDAQGLSWSGNHANNCVWTTTSTSFADPANDASCTFSERTNRNFGTVTTAGASTPGIIFTPKRIGRYFVCATAGVYNSTAAAYSAVQLINVTTGSGISTIGMRQVGSGTNDERISTLCGITDVTSLAANTISLRINASAGTTTLSSASSSNTIEWSIFNMDQLSQSILANSVTTGNQNGDRILRAHINCDGASTVLDTNTNGMTVGNIASGSCAITWPSFGSGSVNCSATSTLCAAPSGARCFHTFTAGPNTTSATVNCLSDAGGVCTSADFQLLCVGPR